VVINYAVHCTSTYHTNHSSTGHWLRPWLQVPGLFGPGHSMTGVATGEARLSHGVPVHRLRGRPSTVGVALGSIPLRVAQPMKLPNPRLHRRNCFERS